VNITSVAVLLFLIGKTAFSQSLSLFDIDASNFPIIKAKFFAIDKDGNQIANLSPSDFDLKENGTMRNVTLVTCPSPKPPQALSSVLIMDASGSMSGDNLNLAKEAAHAWVEGLPLGKSECAISSFDHINYLNQDFTTNKNKLLTAINNLQARGSTHYDAAMLNPLAGGLLVTKDGKYKRVIVFLSDGMPNQEPQTSKIVQEANSQNVTIFGVTLGMSCPQSIKDITTQTGGQWFENVTTVEQARQIYQQVLKAAQGESLNICSIEWQSKAACTASITNVEVALNKVGLYTLGSYSPPQSSIIQLIFEPSYVVFRSKEVNMTHDTIVKLTAINADISVSNITSTNSIYEINPKSFKLNKGQSINLNITYHSTDSLYSYTEFEFENDLCPTTLFASGRYPKYKSKPQTLTVTHPNGSETFVVGSDTVITWEGIPKDEPVKLEYSTNNGKSWKYIDTARNLSYKWKKLSKPASNQCLVKVKQTDAILRNYNFLWSTLALGRDIKWSPDGSMIATCGKNTITLLESTTLDTILTMSGHGNNINSLAFSPDGQMIASGSDDKTIKLWRISDGSEIQTFSGHGNLWVYSVVFSPDGQMIASGSDDKKIKLWRVSDGSEIRTLSGHSNSVLSIAFSPDGEVIASGSSDSTIKLWRISDGSEIRTLSGHSNSVRSVAISPDGQMIASGSSDNTIKYWRVSDGTEIRTLSGHGNYWVRSVVFSPDGQMIASGSSDNSIKIWRVSDGSEIRTLRGHNDVVFGVAFSPDGQMIASGSKDNTIKFWQVSDGSEIRTLSGHNDYVFGLAFSPDGLMIVSGSSSNSIKLWRVSDGSEIRTLSGHSSSVTSVAISPDGQMIASGSSDNTIKLWRVSDGSEIRTLFGHNSSVTSLAISPDGQMITSVSTDGNILFWRLSDGTFNRAISGHSNGVHSLAISPDGQMIAFGLASGSIDFCRVSDGMIIRKLSGHSHIVFSVFFSPDGQMLASGGYDKTIKLWRVSDGSELRTLLGHIDGVYSIAISPDGQMIASGSSDNSIKLWRVSDGSEIRTFSGHSGTVTSLAFSPDGQMFVSGSSDATVKLWVVDDFSIQEDMSDNVFSIIEPNPASKDIDVGKCFVNNIKDSVVTDFIQNIGSWKFRVDSIYFLGVDASAFSLVTGFPEYTIEPNHSYFGEFRFVPNRVGIHSAEIIIVTQSETLHQTIRGEGVDERIAINNAIIDFGTVYVGNEKDTTQVTTIKNISSVPITITETRHGYPNDKDFLTIVGGGNFTLPPGETKLMDLRFTPSDVGRTSGTLEFHYNGVGSPAVVQLFGTGLFFGSASVELRSTQLEGYPGDEINIPVIISKEENLYLASINTIDVEMEFNPTLLYPKNLPIVIIDNNRAKVLIKDMPANKNIGESLSEIPFLVGLGNAQECDIVLMNAKTKGGQANITLLNGNFKLLGICEEGGARLINPYARASINKISPNPAENNVEVEISLIEQGITELLLYNSMGEIILAIMKNDNPFRGIHTIHVNTTILSTGLYFLQLRTPTYLETKFITIIK
jgi:WD40 repeat protein